MSHIRIVQGTQPDEVHNLDAQSHVQVSVESVEHAANALGTSRLLEALRIVGLALRELARLVRRVVGYEGVVEWDTSKPDGTPRKLTDVSRLRSLGWASTVELEDGVRRMCQWYLENRA